MAWVAVTEASAGSKVAALLDLGIRAVRQKTASSVSAMRQTLLKALCLCPSHPCPCRRPWSCSSQPAHLSHCRDT